MNGAGSIASRRPVAGRILLLIALIALTVLVVSRFTDLRQFTATLAHGKWRWITAGLLIHLLFFYLYAILYRIGFGIVGVPSRTNKMFPLVFAAIFVNAVLPTGGTGAAALFVDDAVRRGESGPRATVGVILVLLADVTTLAPFLAWGMIFLALHGEFAYYDAIGIVLFCGYVGALIWMVAYAHRRTAGLTRKLEWLRRLVNRIGTRFHRPELVSEEWPERTALELRDAARAIVGHPGQLAELAVWATIAHAVNAAGIWALVRAFSEAVPLSGLVAVFGMGVVFFIVAPIPQGVAVVETVVTLVLRSLGVPKHTAITIAVLFRGANFWIPLLIGMAFAWRLRGFGQRAAAQAEPRSQ